MRVLSLDKVNKSRIDKVISMLAKNNENKEINYTNLDEINFGETDLSSTSFIAFGKWIQKVFSAEKEREIGLIRYLCYK